jgi:chromosome segregation ATPase
MASSTNIELLAQRLDALEGINTKQSEQIETLQREAAALEGAQKQADRTSNSNSKYVGPAVSVMVLIVSAFIGKFIIDKLDALNTQVVDLTVSAADREARVRTLSDRKIPSLSEVESALAKFDTRITTLESSFSVMQATDGRQDADIVSLRSAQSTSEAKGSAHEQQIAEISRDMARLQDVANTNQRDIRAIDAKTSAGFVEVESQLRGIIATLQVKFDQVEGLASVTYQKVFQVDAPETKPFPADIPAKAFTTIGGDATGK